MMYPSVQRSNAVKRYGMSHTSTESPAGQEYQKTRSAVSINKQNNNILALPVRVSSNNRMSTNRIVNNKNALGQAKLYGVEAEKKTCDSPELSPVFQEIYGQIDYLYDALYDSNAQNLNENSNGSNKKVDSLTKSGYRKKTLLKLSPEECKGALSKNTTESKDKKSFKDIIKEFPSPPCISSSYEKRSDYDSILDIINLYEDKDGVEWFLAKECEDDLGKNKRVLAKLIDEYLLKYGRA